MSRIAALAALLAVLAVPSAAADGCPLPCSGVQSSPPGSQLVFVQPEGEGGRLIAYDVATRRPRFELGAGRASADGRRFVTAVVHGGQTVLERYVVATGRRAARWAVPGRWQLAAVSPTGRWIVLARPGTRIAVLDAVRRRAAHVAELRGRFEVETISADGRRLFLIERLSGGRYRVRLYDVEREALRPKALRGKGEPTVMAGLAWGAVASPDGRWLLTLYLNTDRRVAFVHALDLVSSQPRCIFLPSDGAPGSLARYGLTLAPDGRRLFATNPGLGVVAEIDLTKGRVARTARFAPGSAPAGAAAALAPDGRTLVFAAGRELWAYDVATRRVRGPYEAWARVVGIGFDRAARRFYAVRADGRMLAFDAATGRRL